MASGLRQKTQSAVDALREDVNGCTLALLIDRKTGLVLCKSSEETLPQNRLERIAGDAKADLNTALPGAVPDLAPDAKLISATRLGRSDVTVILHPVGSDDEALVCHFGDMPDRGALSSAATAVFALTTSAEAA